MAERVERREWPATEAERSVVTHLDIRDQHLQALSHEIGQCTALQYLNLSGNELETLRCPRRGATKSSSISSRKTS